MQRNSIILVAVVFCVIAIVTGYIVTGMSSPKGGSISAQAGSTAVATAATTNTSQAPSTDATAAPSPTQASPEATTEPTSDAQPTAAPEPTAASEPTAAPAAGKFIEYTVQRGDELLAIAKKFNVSVKDILANNDIPNPDSLRVSQVLRIPVQ